MGNETKDLYREAVADAKKVRDAAIANARMALEETITPRIQEMLRKKLTEEEDSMDEVDASGQGVDPETGALPGKEIHEEVTEESLDEILAELQNEESLEEAPVEEGEAPVEEGFEFEAKDDEGGEEGAEEAGEEAGEGEEGAAEVPDMTGAEAGEGEQADDQEVVELTVGELKGIIADTLMSLGIGGAEGNSSADGIDEPTLEPANAGTGDVQPGQDDEELSLDEVLASLDETEDEPMAERKQGLFPGKGKEAAKDNPKVKGTNVTSRTPKASPKAETKLGTGMKKTSPSKDYAATKAGSGEHLLKEKGKLGTGMKKVSASTDYAGPKAGSGQHLAEAIKTINFLKKEMNNMNLINAKLLYANKLFKTKTLNEGQKAKILTAFDNLTSIKDVKRVYETLSNTSFKATVGKKKPLKESLGFASKPSGTKAPAGLIVEQQDEVVTRLQELAGIVKRK